MATKRDFANMQNEKPVKAGQTGGQSPWVGVKPESAATPPSPKAKKKKAKIADYF